MLYVLIVILFINIISNITALDYFDKYSLLIAAKAAPWYIKIPNAIWYWLVLLYIYGVIPYIIRIIACAILSYIPLCICLTMTNLTLIQFAVIFGICFLTAILIMSYAITWVCALVSYLIKKKKKKNK